jgi:hypothetical protein
VADGLFDIDVRAGVDGGDHTERMPMIWRADDHDLRSLFLEHFAVVLIFFRLIAGEFFYFGRGRIQLVFVNVAHRDDGRCASGHRLAKYVHSPPAAADKRGSVFFVFRLGANKGPREQSRGGRCLEKITTVGQLGLHRLHQCY